MTSRRRPAGRRALAVTVDLLVAAAIAALWLVVFTRGGVVSP